MDRLSHETIKTLAKRLAVYLNDNRDNDNASLDLFQLFKDLEKTGAITERERFSILFNAIEETPRRIVSQQYEDWEE